MGKVNVLSEDIVAKIAAGEVIERPASVIKELLENAIDAGADSIHITLKEAGAEFIRFKDNGSGIEHDDLEKIFLRHATSKITSADDLYDIHSLGFRGEALFSIAAVADVRMKSKTAEQGEGWEIHVRGGKKQSLEPSAVNDAGTDIEIRELFYNTPARKKFLKSRTSEFNQVLNTVIPYALLHNDIQFKLTHQDKDVIDVSPAKTRQERVTDILGLDAGHLITAKEELPAGMTVDAVLGNINIKRHRRDMQYVFVNGRPVDSKQISFHANQIYRLILAPKEFPFFMLNITLPANEIDVNIHPAKREIKFKNEHSVCSVLRNIIERNLMNKGSMKEVTDMNVKISSPISEQLSTSSPKADFFETSSHSPSEDYAYPAKHQDQATLFTSNAQLETTDPSIHDKFTNATYIGPFMNKFLLFEAGNCLLIVDQHAAQERIMYETFIRQMNAGNIEVQNLLSPVLIQLSPQEMGIYEEQKETITSLGFDNNQFDPRTIAVHSHPSLIYDVERSVRNIIAGEKVNPSDHDTLARRACKASVRAGDKLSAQQAEYQRRQLLECLDPFTCPHGRPTVIELTEDFLDKQFLRT